MLSLLICSSSAIVNPKPTIQHFLSIHALSEIVAQSANRRVRTTPQEFECLRSCDGSLPADTARDAVDRYANGVVFTSARVRDEKTQKVWAEIC